MGTNKYAHKAYEFTKGFVRDRDLFSCPVFLTYKGEKDYKTVPGGAASLLIFIFIFLYSIYLLAILINRDDTNLLTNNLIKNLYEDTQVHNIGQEGFAFAVSYRGPNAELLLDEDYFTLNFTQNRWVKDDNNEWVKTQIDLGVEYCGDNFPYEDQSQIDKLGISNFFCPKSYDYSVASNPYSDYFEFVEITLKPCEGVACGLNSLINSFYEEGYFELAIVNSYFDTDDYETPIKKFLEQGEYAYLVPNFAQLIEIEVKENEAEMKDNYVSGLASKTETFYSIGDKVNKIAPEDSVNAVFRVTFTLDARTTQYEREVYTFMDMIGQIGGIYSLIFVIAQIFLGTLAERFYLRSVLRKLYDFDVKKMISIPEQEEPSTTHPLETNRIQSPRLREELKEGGSSESDSGYESSSGEDNEPKASYSLNDFEAKGPKLKTKGSPKINTKLPVNPRVNMINDASVSIK